MSLVNFLIQLNFHFIPTRISHASTDVCMYMFVYLCICTYVYVRVIIIRSLSM
jgi:hypothetical protein